MKASKKQQSKFIQYRTHHELDMEDDDLGFVLGIIAVIVCVWWGVVHLIDIYFDKLTWWQEPLTIIPFVIVGVPALMMTEIYGKNPMHWWPIFWGVKVTIPESSPWRAYNEELESILEEYGPMRVYHVDYCTLKFRTKKDATIFCLKNHL